MSVCNLCPRACKVVRRESITGEGQLGYCQSGMLPVISRAALHHWEEPCIAGTRGAGTEPLPVPVVYNCGGYESVHTVAFLRKKVQCWLPDLKYYDAEISGKYSDAPDYFERASAAIEQMFKETGSYVIGADGILQRGVLIRHLILPGQVGDTKRILEYVAETFEPGDVLFSLMRQYTPCGRAAEFPEIDRRITDEEYEACESYMEELGIIDGYVQQKESAEAAFIPAFDGTGVLRKR